MKEIEALSANVELLIERYQALREENERLRQLSEQQRDEMMRTHSELLELQQRYRQLSIAHTVSVTAENRERAKQQITSLIQRVDRAIEILKQ